MLLPYVATKLDDVNYHVYQDQNKVPTAKVSSCSKFGIGSQSVPGKNSETQSSCWLVGKWEGCSSTCGEGVSSRSVSCIDLDGNPAADCDESVRPSITKQCQSHSNCNYSWQVGEWGSCQAGCGASTSTRFVTCVDVDNNVVEDVLCSVTSSKPVSEQPCTNFDTCTYKVEYSAWSECSSRCVTGTQTRTAECKRSDNSVVDISFCSDVELVQDCTGTDVCTFDWEYGEWGSCSNTCGDGTRTRTATCMASDGSVASNELCTSTPELSTTCMDNSGCVAYRLHHITHMRANIYLSDASGAKKAFLTTSDMGPETGPAPTKSITSASGSPVYVLFELTKTVADGDSFIWGMLSKEGNDFAYPFEIVAISDPRASCAVEEELWDNFYYRTFQCTIRGYFFSFLVKFEPY